MTKFYFFFFILLSSLNVCAQTPRTWDLRRCVEYAMENNISVKTADITAKLSEVTLNQSKLQQIPSLNFNLNHGISFGRSLNRSTNTFQDANIMYENQSIQTSTTIYNWNSQKNTIAANGYTLEADKQAVNKAKNDIGLNVARQYLLALLSLEQSRVNLVQLEQSKAQYNNTRKLVDAGSLPELNAAELETQVARDSAVYVQSTVQYELDKLALKSLLNISADESFIIETPPVASIPVDNILEITPASVFAIAMQTQPQVKGNLLRIMAADKNYLSAKAKLYPTISAFAQMNTAFNQTFTETYLNGFSESTIGYSKSGATTIPVYTQSPIFATRDRTFGSIWNGYGTSLKNQLGKVIGIGINVPIFNGGQARANVKRALLDKERWELFSSRDTLLLKQDVYTAYEQAVGSHQTFMARVKQVQTAERSFNLASRRYEIGVMQTIEWLTNQNNLTRAKIDMLVSQYDYVFKMKVLEFYKGQGIRL